MNSVLSKLSDSLGKRRALTELSWIRHAARSPHALLSMVNRRSRGEPLQYILGNQPFGPLNILSRAPTLIPRPETEQWTTHLATSVKTQSNSKQPLKMLDFCTGSGCIPLLLCHLLSSRTSAPIYVNALGVDISSSACQLARDNIQSCGVPPGSSLDIRQKSIFDDDFEEFIRKEWPSLQNPNCSLQLDIVTANPPYIPTDQWKSLSSEVKDWEDPLALLGDPPGTPDSGGLTFYKRIMEIVSGGILSPRAILALEVGDGQAGDVADIFGSVLGNLEIWKDWYGKERAVIISSKANGKT